MTPKYTSSNLTSYNNDQNPLEVYDPKEHVVFIDQTKERQINNENDKKIEKLDNIEREVIFNSFV